jgi:hypothetical protein
MVINSVNATDLCLSGSQKLSSHESPSTPLRTLFSPSPGPVIPEVVIKTDPDAVLVNEMDTASFTTRIMKVEWFEVSDEGIIMSRSSPVTEEVDVLICDQSSARGSFKDTQLVCFAH